MRKILAVFFATVALLFVADDANALMWNDPGVTPVQSISDHRWRDANTGRLINVTGMPNATPTPTPTPTLTPSLAPTPSPAPSSSGTTTPRTNWGSMSKAARAGAALGIAGGAAGVYASTAGQGEHSGWNVAGGAASGAIAGASIGSIFPVIGTGIGAAAGAVIGGLISGSQLFSETDCLYDPVTGIFTCCNTVFNQGERQANIGDYMFCGVEQDGTNVIAAPGVRQCLQGKMKDESTWSDTAAGWWDGMWVDDFWQPECVARYCTESGAPAEGIESYIEYIPDTTNYCWNWDCVSGYTRSGNTCIAASTNEPVNPYTTPESPNANPYDVLIQQLQQYRTNIIRMCGHMLGTNK